MGVWMIGTGILKIEPMPMDDLVKANYRLLRIGIMVSKIVEINIKMTEWIMNNMEKLKL